MMDDEDCLELFLKQRCNMFGIWEDSLCIGYGVYPTASYFNHSCAPNATYRRDHAKTGALFDFCVLSDVAAGAELCIR
jgi:hypothetical protein